MKKKPNKKKYSLDELADYMDKQELGEASLDEVDTIGEYIEDLRTDNKEEI